MIASLRFAVASAVGVVCALPLAAQRHVPATYAITGARIVPVSGPVIDKGTIVIRDGVIAAVGASVATPADARIVDGTGLTVYPGLIDAYGSLGMGGAAAAAAGTAAGTAGRGGRGATTAVRGEGAPNSTNVTGLRPEINVVDELNGADGEFDAAHAAGFTAALTAVSQGIFRGQAAVINLTDDSASAIVVRAGVAQSIGFARGGGGRGGFPGSLMGAFAALRQEFLDAQHYRDVNAAYAKNPRGSMRRPTFDASLEALQPLLAGKQMAIMQASTEREIIRALDLAKEFGLKAVIAGGAEAYKVASRLKAENVPVLLTLNFPRAAAAGAAGGGGRGGAADPADPEPLRMLRDRVMAPKGPKMLADMGVKFAFQSGSGYTDMLSNLRKAVVSGLPADQAIRALTMQPAELFGVSDRLGSIEAGKVANLTITRGELTDTNARVTQLFVDGNPIAIPAAAAAASGGGGRGNRPGGGYSASGAWLATVSIDGREYTVTLHIWQDGERLAGELQGDLGAVELTDGSVARDGTFSFFARLSLRGGTVDAEFNGTVDRNGLRAQVDAEGHKSGSLSASHSN